MTKPCPPDLAAFKHEPADYEQPVEAVTPWTPGPWTVDLQTEIAGPNGEYVALAYTETNADGVGEANARLIAAAPEGFGLIEQLEESFTADGTYQQFLPAMRAYLTKARGGA